MLGKWIDKTERYPIYTIGNDPRTDHIPLAISEEKYEEYKKVTDEFWTFQEKLEEIYNKSRNSIQ